jgi:hypothetical protein
VGNPRVKTATAGIVIRYGRRAVNESVTSSLSRLRERWRDPLLTTLTLLLALLMFVLAPLQAVGITGAQDLGFAIALVVIAAAVVLSGNPIAIIVMLAAVGLAVTAAVLRLQQPSTLDVYLKASAWILMGLALIWVVTPAVFAPGRVTYHRVIGAILLYLAIGWTFAGLFTLVGLLVPNAFSGMIISDSPALASTMAYFSFGTLTHRRFWRYCPAASDCAQSLQFGGDDRAALSGNLIGKARDA